MQASSITGIQELLLRPTVKAAFEFFESQAAKITEEQIEICSIAAPPFGEQARAQYLLRKFDECGLGNVELDAAGNCLALYNGCSSKPLLVISAHLDTVFPVETDLTLRRSGNRLLAPGISDDGCGLAALIALARVLTANEIETETSILFVGSVGEEGAGNLRGVRHLFTEGKWAEQIAAFISFDVPALIRLQTSPRFTPLSRPVSCPGGHSWEISA